MNNLLLETNKMLNHSGNPIWFLLSKTYRCNITYNAASVLSVKVPATYTDWSNCTLTSIYDLHLNINDILWRQGYFYIVE